MRWLALVVTSAACGRVGFDAQRDGAGGDVVAIRRPCGASPHAPNPLTLRGDVFQYTDFQNDRMTVSGAALTALASDGSALATTTSDASGYQMAITTGGMAQNIRIRAEHAALFTTTTYLDTVVDHDVAVFTSAQWSYGEAPLWSPGSMGSIYGSAGVSIDNSKGSYNVIAEDCSGAPLGGVTITVDPAPALQTYIAANGTSDFGTHTITPFSSAVGFNQPPGPAHITATAPNLEFAPVDVTIDAGDFTTLVLMQPLI